MSSFLHPGLGYVPGLFGGQERNFLPDDVDGCSLWLSAKRSEITETAGAISAVADLSGNSNTATQDTAISRPALNSTILDGQPGFVFDGVDDFLLTANDLGTVSAETLVLLLQKTIATSGEDTLVGANGNPTYTFRVRTGTGGTCDWTVVGFNDGINSARSFSLFPVNTPTIVVLRRSVALNTIQAFRNGTNVIQTTHTTGAVTNTRYILGRRGDPVTIESFEGALGEAFAYNRYLIDEEIDRITGYVAHEWGIQSGLPGGHPYKDSPPTV